MWVWIVLIGLVLALIVLNMLYLRFQFNYDILYAEQEKHLCIGVIPVFKRFRWEKKISTPSSPVEWIDLAADFIDKKKAKNNEQDASGPQVKKRGFRAENLRSRFKIPFSDYYRLFCLLMSHMVLERLDWRTSLGLDDAMNTALACGGIWALKGYFMALISHFSSLEQVVLGVDPVYNETGFSSQLDSIFKIRIVYIMLIIIFASIISVRGYINGFAARKTQTSY